MKRILIPMLVIVMLVSAAACSNTEYAGADKTDTVGTAVSAEPTATLTEHPLEGLGESGESTEEHMTPDATEAPALETHEMPTEYSTSEEVLSVPAKLYTDVELKNGAELGQELTYLKSDGMEYPCYAPQAFCVTDDGEIAIVDTIGARLMVYDTASGQLKRSIALGEALGCSPIRVTKGGGVYYVLIPYYNTRIAAIDPDDTVREIPVPQLKEKLNYTPVTEFYVEDGRLIITLLGESNNDAKEISLEDGSLTALYSTKRKLVGDTFTVTRGDLVWRFHAQTSTGTFNTSLDVLKIDADGNLYVVQRVNEGEHFYGLFQIFDKDSRLLTCEKIEYFPDSIETVEYGRIVGPDGDLYEMRCCEDAVIIVRTCPAE